MLMFVHALFISMPLKAYTVSVYYGRWREETASVEFQDVVC